jgi:putative ABC transport system permease protein
LLEWSFVFRTAGRDLSWRARRWVIATVGTAVTFTVTMLLAGFLASFHAEVDSTLDAIGGDGFVVRATAPGPFTSLSPIPLDHLAALEADPGVTAVSPLIALSNTARVGDDEEVVDLLLVARHADGPGAWPIDEGRGVAAPGEVVVDGRIGAEVGDEITVANRSLRVVGTTSGVHIVGGRGVAWVGVDELQTLLFAGQPLVSGFVVDGRPTAVPDGTHFVDHAAGRDDLLRLVRPIIKSMTTFRLLMWIVSSAIVASVLYLTALDRVRDFAVFKATGTRDRELVASLLLQSVLLALVASALAAVLAVLIAPTFPTPVLFTGALFVVAPVTAVVIGCIGSLAGVRRAITTDPALAFGGA